MAEVSATSSLGLGLTASGNDITVQVKFKRLRHQLAIPIKVVDNVTTASVVTTTAVCVCAVVGSYLVGVRPYQREKIVSEMNRRIRKTQVLRGKALAEIQRMVTMHEYSQAVAKEERGGLLIHCALFGHLPSGSVVDALSQSPAGERWVAVGAPYIDITVPMQCRVTHSSLVLSAGMDSKIQLDGVYDPCPDKKQKQIYVAYTHRGQSYSRLWDADGEVAVPTQI